MVVEKPPYRTTPSFPRSLLLGGAGFGGGWIALVVLLDGAWGANGFVLLSGMLGMALLLAITWQIAGMLAALHEKYPWHEIVWSVLLTVLLGGCGFLAAALCWPLERVAITGFRPTVLSAPSADITHALRTRHWRGLRVIHRFWIKPGRRLVVATAHRRLSVALQGSVSGLAFEAVHVSADIRIPPRAISRAGIRHRSDVFSPPHPRWAIYLDRHDAAIRYTPQVLQAMLRAMRRGLVLLRTRDPVSRAMVRASWRHRVTIHARGNTHHAH